MNMMRLTSKSLAKFQRIIDGIYVRNTENPVHDAIGRYHPFDGDGMLPYDAFPAERRNIKIASFAHGV